MFPKHQKCIALPVYEFKDHINECHVKFHHMSKQSFYCPTSKIAIYLCFSHLSNSYVMKYGVIYFPFNCILTSAMAAPNPAWHEPWRWYPHFPVIEEAKNLINMNEVIMMQLMLCVDYCWYHSQWYKVTRFAFLWSVYISIYIYIYIYIYINKCASN